MDSVYDAAITRNLALLGENPEAAVAKSVFRPDELTESDAVVLTQFYTALIISWMRNKDEHGLGYFEDSFEDVVSSEAYFLTTEPGRRWWAVARTTVDPELARVVDEALSTTSPGAVRFAIETISGDREPGPDG